MLLQGTQKLIPGTRNTEMGTLMLIQGTQKLIPGTRNTEMGTLMLLQGTQKLLSPAYLQNIFCVNAIAQLMKNDCKGNSNWAWGMGHWKQFWILDLRFWIRFQSKIRLEKFAQRGEPPHATFRKI